MIWFNKNITIDEVRKSLPNTMGQNLGMDFTNIGPDFLEMTMPVDERTKQPAGLLHGGASCALAETIGSVASYLVVDSSKFYPVGLEINANHLRSKTSGFVTARCIPLHLGATTHIWDIKITDERQKLVCVSRLTVMITKKAPQV
jgi:1,4-dihydroxy-2-naphthoyl-CoA hydrolase